MSRSYKKSPVCKSIHKGYKRFANKKIRQYSDEIPNGRLYKKIYESCTIIDQNYRMTFDEYETHYKELWNNSEGWYKAFKRK